jgi:hypothetical protein
MKHQEVQYYLKDMAENCLNLAKRLSSTEGSELTADEERLIVYAHMPMMRECYEMGVGALVAGNAKQAYEHFMRMAEVTEIVGGGK